MGPVCLNPRQPGPAALNLGGQAVGPSAFTHGRWAESNNAWRLRPDWDVSIHPEDFPPEHRPGHSG